MSRRTATLLIRSAFAPAVATLLVGYFVSYALFGANGVFALGDYRAQLEVRSGELSKLDLERKRLAHRVALLDPKRADPDMADELVRRELGLARPDEVILDLR